MSKILNSCILGIDRITGFHFKAMDPFLFAVHHVDHYPVGNDAMEVPGKRGNGADFNLKAPFRFYHGDKIPGFPQHPHRGFETITATVEGVIDHSDSLGSCGRYGNGDLQWMTAGKGVVHGEMFPLVNNDKPNPCRLFQIWINLPPKDKMVNPEYVIHWHENIPKVVSESSGFSRVTVWAGTYKGITVRRAAHIQYSAMTVKN
jgi:redox-sensitive bicupin YhaK (pirin superfamily)